MVQGYAKAVIPVHNPEMPLNSLLGELSLRQIHQDLSAGSCGVCSLGSWVLPRSLSQTSEYSEETHLLSPKTRFCLFLSLKYDSVMKNETVVPVGGLQEREVYSGIKIC